MDSILARLAASPYEMLQTLLVYFIALHIEGVVSLKCYKCLNLDCPDGGRGQRNELLCQSVRSYIIKSLNPYYEIGPTGYIGSCPSKEETLQWSMMQLTSPQCPDIREGATCSLGRLQVLTGPVSGRHIVSHATVLGCLKPALLYHMKRSSPNTNFIGCSTFLQNNTGESPQFTHKLLLENCPKVTDYCTTKSFCVPYDQSIVKPFQTGKAEYSFENGFIIGIIILSLVVITVAFLAGTCQNPLNRSTNYSPTNVQITNGEVLPEDEDCDHLPS